MKIFNWSKFLHCIWKVILYQQFLAFSMDFYISDNSDLWFLRCVHVMCHLELFQNQMWQLISLSTGSFWDLGVEKSRWDVSWFIFHYDIILYLSLSIRDFTSTEIFSQILWNRFTLLYLSVLNPAILCNPPSVCICIPFFTASTFHYVINFKQVRATCFPPCGKYWGDFTYDEKSSALIPSVAFLC